MRKLPAGPVLKVELGSSEFELQFFHLNFMVGLKGTHFDFSNPQHKTKMVGIEMVGIHGWSPVICIVWILSVTRSHACENFDSCQRIPNTGCSGGKIVLATYVLVEDPKHPISI